MAVRQPKYSKDEFARRGTELYEQVRPLVEASHQGMVVAIDIDTGDYEVADDTLEACQQLLARCPAAQPWCVRIGHRAVDRFGFHNTAEKSVPGNANSVMTAMEHQDD
jgi:hypothetical protein